MYHIQYYSKNIRQENTVYNFQLAISLDYLYIFPVFISPLLLFMNRLVNLLKSSGALRSSASSAAKAFNWSSFNLLSMWHFSFNKVSLT